VIPHSRLLSNDALFGVLVKKSRRELLPAGRGRFALILSVRMQLAISLQLLAFSIRYLGIILHTSNPQFSPLGRGGSAQRAALRRGGLMNNEQ